ncbi:MAG TPA: 16S rRNA (adenine(1518)-N(6)/adenine(1519)-N(6))-dimethyltransferase RsmA [Candidatus Omnitrophota bacterium]|nr:16S rRNA (adenine(1518)-N(6)/adenine(1519)-N(6))-dimethyltransferase RsmA [Candidatus Omnitrophota bacterium]
MLTKKELKELFLEYGFRPLKRYGENYLVDNNIKDKIVGELGLLSNDRVLEIGPGLGALTIDIAESGAELTAVEKDRKACAILSDLLGDSKNTTILNRDVLDYDIPGFAGERKIKIVGNLPYYITSPIIEKIITAYAVTDFAVILVQKEFANRLAAGPGSKEYGSLSCFVQYRAAISYIHTVKRSSFYPEPEVDSAIVRLDMLKKPPVEVADERLLFKVIRGAFNQRRKSLINSLSREEVLDLPKDTLAKVFLRARVDPGIRPESMDLDDFARIVNSL